MVALNIGKRGFPSYRAERVAQNTNPDFFGMPCDVVCLLGAVAGKTHRPYGVEGAILAPLALGVGERIFCIIQVI